MTEKRFVIPNQMRVIRDTVTGEEAIFYDTEDGLLLKKWLNALHKENEHLKSENQEVKDILNELKSINCYWDSALLQEYIDRIANVLGVDLK